MSVASLSHTAAIDVVLGFVADALGPTSELQSRADRNVMRDRSATGRLADMAYTADLPYTDQLRDIIDAAVRGLRR